MAKWVFGVDIGGTGIKAAPVDVTTGTLKGARQRIDTPSLPTPEHIATGVARLASQWSWKGPVGVGFPGVVKRGIVHTAANLHETWIGVDAAALLAQRLGTPVSVGNDADVAGLAEMTFGAGNGVMGVVLMVTLGTGIGSGLFLDGRLVPNTELGHIEIDGRDAETRAAAIVRERKKLSWKQYGRRVDEYLARLENLLWPDLVIIGGGVSADFDKFGRHLHRRTRVVAAAAGNDAGIIGAALYRSTLARAVLKPT